MNILVTGAAGFIGFSLCKNLSKSKKVIGIDSLNAYYDVKLKKKRLQILQKNKNFFFIKADICDEKKLAFIFKKYKINKVVHLAAQAGVRYSIKNPKEYISSNLVGFFNMINCSRKQNVSHFIYASTSSVYGKSLKKKFKETDVTEKPLSLYAATKKSNELMAFNYSSMFNLRTTGLRFFTVYGPWGRPDMALYKFTKGILREKKIDVYNYGNHMRDFTYIDDVVKCIKKVLNNKPKKNKNLYQVYNICSSSPVKLLRYIKLIEKNLSKKAKINFLPLQKGDVKNTFGVNKEFLNNYGYKPIVKVEYGIKNFVNWYTKYILK
jgi:UDP-glucuronate 4-epimerase